MAKEQFEEDVRMIESAVIGKGLKIPTLQGMAENSHEAKMSALENYAADLTAYARELEGTIKTLIREMTVRMRGIALMGQKVNENSLRAAAVASAANNAAQTMIEVHATRQLGLRKTLESFKDVISAQSISEFGALIDLDAAAPADREGVMTDFREAEERLVQAAVERGDIGEVQANKLLTKSMRAHSEQKGGQIPKWRR